MILNCEAAVLPLSAISTAAPPAISTVTVPSAAGATNAVYTAPLPPKLPTAPFPTVISDMLNPVTSSLNVMVIEIVTAFVGLVSLLIIVTVGTVASNSIVSLIAVDSLPAASLYFTYTVFVPSPLLSVKLLLVAYAS
ncbi:MAG: hypothetical protein C5S52_00185 [ANME-2 cluster archaeon]|nr:hypothetical protein [ANME-2 cluster archaeon]